MEEKGEFEAGIEELVPQEKEGVMKIVTSWMREGLEQGLGHARNVLLRQLRKRLGELDGDVTLKVEALPPEELEQLGEALLDFTCRADLDAWLEPRKHGPSNGRKVKKKEKKMKRK